MTNIGENYIRFDWAMKRLLRNKANYAVSGNDRQAYYRHMESVRHMKSLFDTSRDEGYEEGREKGREERSFEIARQLKSIGMTKVQIFQATGLYID